MPINQNWLMRPAKISDVDQIVEAVRLLLAELRGVPGTILPSTSSSMVNEVINKNIPGAIFIAETVGKEKSCVGIITISIQGAIHVGGQYALIQELWVHPNYRSFAIGAQLMNAAEEFCREHNLKDLEVCLPKRNFETFENTYHFYQKVGFIELGPRMKKGVGI